MADVDEFSLLGLEDELTCSICLSTFDCPVTIPCGHNFCQDCLLKTWTDSYSCPQCRTHFATKPELKKNTVLSTVVETFNLRSTKGESSVFKEEKEAEKIKVIRCDTCMEAEASQTCLTCMASFCEEHLRPHRENPNFRVHQLSEPVGDLLERICPDHHKLMELFCSQHGRPICSLCLQQVHKGCSFTSPEEQRSLKESELRDKLGLLDGKIEKTEAVISQMNETQSKLKDGAIKRKALLAATYQQIRDMLAQEEQKAHIEVDCELEVGQMKLRNLMKRLTDNAEAMRKVREDVNSLLSQSHTLDFLQTSFDLPGVVKFDPHMPRINLDSKKVTATQAFAAELKENLTEILKQPVEARLPLIKPQECPELNTDISASGKRVVPAQEPANTNSTGPRPEHEPPEQKIQPTSHSPGHPPIQPVYQPIPVPVYSYVSYRGGWNPSQHAQSRDPPFKAKFKKSDASHQTHHKQEKKPPSASGGKKPSSASSDFTKKDKPKNDSPGKKPTGHKPQSKKH
ncbi:E3 ubiquitin/ISG15 ligase TRIM25-like [Anabas testudineus]|uniref:E3 ubiquitin/ISG15 ligase TRIM25-like n=1 Tax=Anabas testudineus TaxID=64144 RepID=UPI000E454117|nr:E3 ubiquitin/ISG15 ligase TRIM25-like [Anabas testudineus]